MGKQGAEQREQRRYVVLRHEGTAEYKPGLHWDLMFESGPSLRTWALAELPAADREIEAEQLPDHRLSYLDYEGPISAGRGSVTRYDAGQYALIAESAEEWFVALRGEKLCGRLALRRAAGKPIWRCTYGLD